MNHETFNQDSHFQSPRTKADFKVEASARNRVVSRILFAFGLDWIPNTLAM